MHFSTCFLIGLSSACALNADNSDVYSQKQHADCPSVTHPMVPVVPIPNPAPMAQNPPSVVPTNNPTGMAPVQIPSTTTPEPTHDVDGNHVTETPSEKSGEPKVPCPPKKDNNQPQQPTTTIVPPKPTDNVDGNHVTETPSEKSGEPKVPCPPKEDNNQPQQPTTPVVPPKPTHDVDGNHVTETPSEKSGEPKVPSPPKEDNNQPQQPTTTIVPPKPTDNVNGNHVTEPPTEQPNVPTKTSVPCPSSLTCSGIAVIVKFPEQKHHAVVPATISSKTGIDVLASLNHDFKFAAEIASVLEIHVLDILNIDILVLVRAQFDSFLQILLCVSLDGLIHAGSEAIESYKTTLLSLQLSIFESLEIDVAAGIQATLEAYIAVFIQIGFSFGNNDCGQLVALIEADLGIAGLGLNILVQLYLFALVHVNLGLRLSLDLQIGI